MKVHQIMTQEVISIPEDATVEVAARLLITHRISAVPVVTLAGDLVGMVNLSDLFPRLKDMRFSGQRMAKLYNSLVNLADLPDFYWQTRHLPVADVMQRYVPSIKANDELEKAVTQLLYSDYRSLPVVDDGKLVGVISLSDLIRVGMVFPEKEATHE